MNKGDFGHKDDWFGACWVENWDHQEGCRDETEDEERCMGDNKQIKAISV